jgi:hypothetical protein
VLSATCCRMYRRLNKQVIPGLRYGCARSESKKRGRAGKAHSCGGARSPLCFSDSSQATAYYTHADGYRKDAEFSDLFASVLPCLLLHDGLSCRVSPCCGLSTESACEMRTVKAEPFKFTPMYLSHAVVQSSKLSIWRGWPIKNLWKPEYNMSK